MQGDASTAAEHFDAVVVGSGFGGSVMASRLAESGWSVCVLERGRPYPPGSFARSPYDMARNAWDPSDGTYGLFDFWSFSGLSSVVSSGLGGGSLIYSNVMLRKDRDWFVDEKVPAGGAHEWPLDYDDLEPHYQRVEKRIGVQTYPFDVPPYDHTERTRSLFEAGQSLGLSPMLPPLAVTFGNEGRRPVPGQPIDDGHQNLHGAPRVTCRLVAECNLGCNYGSKNSLDFTYLTDAARSGAELRTLCEVRSFERVGDRFLVEYRHHDTSRTSEFSTTRQVTGSNLILAAGTFGTTYLLLRNRSAFPMISPKLGSRFSGNGDCLGLVVNAKRHTASGVEPRRMRPSFGPAISSALRVPDDVGGRGFYIEDAGYPDLVSWMTQVAAPSQLFRVARFVLARVTARVTNDRRTNISSVLRSTLGNAILTDSSSSFAGIGCDVPDGSFRLREGFLELDWSSRSSRPYFKRVNGKMHELARALDATYLTNALWWLNLLVTVHPLGGCPMASDPGRGVVNTSGEVFGCPRLFVADGSVMPGPVGANPSLTIAALADRFADALIERGPA